MWVKYEFICTNCDSLYEVTSMNALIAEPACLCGYPHIIRINKYDVTDITTPELANASAKPL